MTNEDDQGIRDRVRYGADCVAAGFMLVFTSVLIGGPLWLLTVALPWVIVRGLWDWIGRFDALFLDKVFPWTCALVLLGMLGHLVLQGEEYSDWRRSR